MSELAPVLKQTGRYRSQFGVRQCTNLPCFKANWSLPLPVWGKKKSEFDQYKSRLAFLAKNKLSHVFFTREKSQKLQMPSIFQKLNFQKKSSFFFQIFKVVFFDFFFVQNRLPPILCAPTNFEPNPSSHLRGDREPSRDRQTDRQTDSI